MTTLHHVLGIGVVVALGALVVWAIVARVARRDPGAAFSRAALAAGVLVVLQVAIGFVLLGAGHKRPALHYLYGVLALGVLGVGIVLGRSLTRDRWVPIAIAVAVALGLAARALVTGLR